MQINIAIIGRTLVALASEPLVARNVGEVMAVIALDPSWADYAVTLEFCSHAAHKSVLYAGGEVVVPWEVLEQPGHLWISAVGIADGKRRVTAEMLKPLTITRCGCIHGDDPKEYSPTLWEQALAEIQRLTAASSVTSEDVLEILAETGTAVPVTDNNGAVYTDNDGKIYCI